MQGASIGTLAGLLVTSWIAIGNFLAKKTPHVLPLTHQLCQISGSWVLRLLYMFISSQVKIKLFIFFFGGFVLLQFRFAKFNILDTLHKLKGPGPGLRLKKVRGKKEEKRE